MKKPHRGMKRGGRVCRVRDLGSCARGRGRGRVGGRNLVSTVAQGLLRQFWGGFTGGLNLMGRCVAHRIGFLRPGSRSRSGRGSGWAARGLLRQV